MKNKCIQIVKNVLLFEKGRKELEAATFEARLPIILQSESDRMDEETKKAISPFDGFRFNSVFRE